MMLYCGTDEAVPPSEWHEGESAFAVQMLSEEAVRVQFSKPHVVYLGSHTGCSCGFSYGQTEAESPEDVKEEEMSRRSVRELREFLVDRVAAGGHVELFSCWAGDETTEPEERLTITPTYFGGREFRLPEKVLFVVRQDETATRHSG